MPRPWNFSWADASETTFDPDTHGTRWDLSLISWELEHSEGEFPKLTIVIENPRVPLLGVGRQQWAWLSENVNGVAEPIIFARCLGSPDNLIGDTITLKFVSEPEDYEEQKHAVAQTLKVRPGYDPICLDVNRRDDPDAILEGYPMLYHIGRTDLVVSVSNILAGEDGTVVFLASEIIKDSVDQRISQPSLRSVSVDMSVPWSQASSGLIDMGSYIIETLNYDSLISSWPKTGQSIGGGWSVHYGNAVDLSGAVNTFMFNHSYIWHARQGNHIPGDTMSVNSTESYPIGPILQTAELTRFVQVGYIDRDPDVKDIQPAIFRTTSLYVIGPGRVQTSLTLRYDAGRDRSEHVRMTITSNLQELFNTTSVLPSEQIEIQCADVALPVLAFDHLTKLPLTIEGPPIVDPQRTTYFTTDRGNWTVEHGISRALAMLAYAARCVTISFECSFEKARDLSCRMNAQVYDPRILGEGVAVGKIISYRLYANVNRTVVRGNVTMACTIGRGGSTISAPTDPVYAVEGYMAPGYQAYDNAVGSVGSVIGNILYSIPVAATNQDGMTFPLTRDQVVLREQWNNTLASETAAIQPLIEAAILAARFAQANPNPTLEQQREAALASKNPLNTPEDSARWYDLQLKVIDKEGLEAAYEVIVSPAEFARMIDLEGVGGGGIPSGTGSIGGTGGSGTGGGGTGGTGGPPAPAISSVSDSGGAVVTGGTTDETVLTVRISLAGTGAAEGDTVQLYDRLTAIGSMIVLDVTNVSDGFVDVVTPSLGDDHIYAFNAVAVTVGGTSGPSQESYFVTVDVGGDGIGGGGGPSSWIMGVNLASAEFSESVMPGTYNVHYTYPTAQEVDYYASKGFTIIRLPFRWERLQPTQNGALNAAEQGRLTTLVNYITSKGLICSIDPHNYDAYYNVFLSPKGSVPTSAFADFWTKLANLFKTNPNVWFCLMNEPNCTGSQWLPNANAAIAAIRATGATNKISVPGGDWTVATNWFSSNNDSVMLGVIDSGSNFIFEVHQYLDAAQVGSGPAVNGTIGSTRLAAFTDWCRTNGYQALLGEMGCRSSGVDLVALDDAMNFIHSNQDVWVGATYWAGGPWWGSYILSCEPSGLGTGSVIDKPQIAVLQGYIAP